jgi:hypothetical protein
MLGPVDDAVFEGGCTCRRVRYRMSRSPLFVHCCHCTWCQRETGTAFALNALVEAEHVALLGDAPELVHTPSASGRGQRIARCPTCRVAVWSHYPGGGDGVCFIRVGSLDEPQRLPPDMHIYTSTKQPWVVLPPGARAVPEFYELEQHWPPASLERLRAAQARAAARTA